MLDLGCGNGRNLKFLREQGFEDVIGVDLKPPLGCGCQYVKLGHDRLPVFSDTVNVVLLCYVLMFLDRTERAQLYREIHRILGPKTSAIFGQCVVVELYPAKDSHFPTKESLKNLACEVSSAFPDLERMSKNDEHFWLC